MTRAVQLTALICLLFTLSGCGGGGSSTTGTTNSATLSAASATQKQVTLRNYRAETDGTPPPQWAADAFQKSVAFLKANGLTATPPDANDTFTLLRVEEDDLGYTNTRVVRQWYGYRVVGQQAIVETRTATGEYVDTFGGVNANFSRVKKTAALLSPALGAVLVVFVLGLEYKGNPALCWEYRDVSPDANGNARDDTVYKDANTSAEVYRTPNSAPSKECSVTIGVEKRARRLLPQPLLAQHPVNPFGIFRVQRFESPGSYRNERKIPSV